MFFTNLNKHLFQAHGKDAHFSGSTFLESIGFLSQSHTYWVKSSGSMLSPTSFNPSSEVHRYDLRLHTSWSPHVSFLQLITCLISETLWLKLLNLTSPLHTLINKTSSWAFHTLLKSLVTQSNVYFFSSSSIFNYMNSMDRYVNEIVKVNISELTSKIKSWWDLYIFLTQKSKSPSPSV